MPARWAPAARRWLCGLTAAASPHPPQGDYQVLLELHNQDQATVACANATVLYS